MAPQPLPPRIRELKPHVQSGYGQSNAAYVTLGGACRSADNGSRVAAMDSSSAPMFPIVPSRRGMLTRRTLTICRYL